MVKLHTLIRLFLRSERGYRNSTQDKLEAIKTIKQRCPNLKITGVWPIVEPQDEGNKFRDRLRISGQSTRMIDSFIQELFNTGQVLVFDHYNGKVANEMTVSRFKKRLESEHRNLLTILTYKKNADGTEHFSLLEERGTPNGGFNKINLKRALR